MSTLFIRRTYEPLKFLGRLFWVPMQIHPETSLVSYAPTWDAEDSRWGPTLIFRFPLTQWGFGVGIWLDHDRNSIVAVHEEDIAYDTFVAVNGPIDRARYDAARKTVAAQGMDPDQEMEAMQMLGIME